MREQPLGVAEDQLGPLVAGEPAREADRERVRIEQRAGGDDARGADVLVGPALPRALADEREQVVAQRLARRPQLLVRDLEDARPERRVVVAIAPAGVEVVVEQPRHLGRHPRRHVDAVGDRADRPLVVRDARPERRPHLARDLAVQLADGVDRARRPQRERRHVELRPAAVVVVAERQERVAVLAERAPAPARCVSTRLNGNASWPAGTGVCVVKTVVRRTSSSAVVERVAALEQIADALQHDERRVAFVEVPDRRRRARARAARARRRGRGRSPAAGACRGRRRRAAPTARDPTARSLRGRCRAGSSLTRPSRTRHTYTSTVRLPSGTATTQGLPSGVMRAARSARSPSSAARTTSCCQPSGEMRWWK